MTIAPPREAASRWLANARIPAALVQGLPLRATDPVTGLATLDFGIGPDGTLSATDRGGPRIDLGGRIVLPTFIDSHVHLDKAYIIRRTGVPSGGLLDAVGLASADAANWSEQDLQSRMTRALESAYLHGTAAMRTHLDTPDMPLESTAWRVMDALRTQWRGRIALQAVALMALERVEQPDFAERCRQLAQMNGILGAFIAPRTASAERLDALFAHARAAGLSVDFHVDETLDPTANGLELICDSVLRTGFSGGVVAGHCCSLSSLEAADRARVIGKVAQAGVHVIALPHSNLFLQDRVPDATPRRRGVTMVRELRAGRASVHFASDNVQDPFYPYGDFDMIEVFRSAVRAAHLDAEIGDWAVRLFRDAATACGFAHHGRIAAGAPADLIVTDATDWYDLVGRPSSARLVLRGGMPLPSVSFSLRDAFAVEKS